MGTHAFFIAPHPDDELLSMGMSILNHVYNGDNIVHLVLLNAGENSGVFDVAAGTQACWYHSKTHDPVAEGYAPFTVESFKAGKIENFKRVAYILGVKPEHIHIYDTVNEDTTVQEVRDIILDLNARYPNNKWKSLSYHDTHPDHSNAGQALLDEYNAGTIGTDVRFYAKNSLVRNGWWDANTTTRIFPEGYEDSWLPYRDAAV
ncbi:MAG TPA: PIG-L family deacetylase, partial [Bacillales bacterium]|nr:PIG-L family deacetylase [Bacillales bacterium]